VKVFTLKSALEFNRENITGNNSLRIMLADPSGRWFAGIAGSNPAEGMGVCLL